MSIVEGIVRGIASCVIIVLIMVVLLVLARYAFELRVVDPAYFLVHIVNEANASVLKSPLPNVARWISTLTWLEDDVRRTLAEFFQVQITLIHKNELTIIDCIHNLIALMSLTAFSAYLPFILAISHGLLLFDPRYGGDLRWILMVVSLPLGFFLSLIAFLAILAVWVLALFDNMTFGYFAGWLVGGFFLIWLGPTFSSYLLVAPIQYSVPKHVMGSFGNIAILKFSVPRALFSKILHGVTWLYYSLTSSRISDAEGMPSGKRSQFYAQRAQAFSSYLDAQREVLRKKEEMEKAKRDFDRTVRGELSFKERLKMKMADMAELRKLRDELIRERRERARAEGTPENDPGLQRDIESIKKEIEREIAKLNNGNDLNDIEGEIESIIAHTASVTEAIERLMQRGEELKRKHEARSDISDDQKKDLLEVIDNQIEDGIRRLRAKKAKGA